MKKYTDAVHEFHTAFGLGIKNEPTAHIGEDRNLLRFNLIDRKGVGEGKRVVGRGGVRGGGGW